MSRQQRTGVPAATQQEPQLFSRLYAPIQEFFRRRGRKYVRAYYRRVVGLLRAVARRFGIGGLRYTLQVPFQAFTRDYFRASIVVVPLALVALRTAFEPM